MERDESDECNKGCKDDESDECNKGCDEDESDEGNKGCDDDESDESDEGNKGCDDDESDEGSEADDDEQVADVLSDSHLVDAGSFRIRLEKKNRNIQQHTAPLNKIPQRSTSYRNIVGLGCMTHMRLSLFFSFLLRFAIPAVAICTRLGPGRFLFALVKFNIFNLIK